jgi:DNA-binding HxlR family transcriptional regulator
MIYTDHMKTSTDCDSSCLESTLGILGDKWTPLLLHALTDVPHSFCEIEASLEGISPRTLSQRLEKLVIEGIITKNMYCEHPPRYKYGLTPKGEALRGVLNQMSAWGAKYA